MSLYPNLGYDMARDFAPITLLASTPNVLVVNAAVRVASVQELLALARARPRALNFASSGVGTSVTSQASSSDSWRAWTSCTFHARARGPALVGLLGDEAQVALRQVTAAACDENDTVPARAVSSVTTLTSATMP